MTNPSAHARIMAVLSAHGITKQDVIDRQIKYAVGGPVPSGDFLSWAFGPGLVAAMLELVVEAKAADTKRPAGFPAGPR